MNLLSSLVPRTHVGCALCAVFVAPGAIVLGLAGTASPAALTIQARVGIIKRMAPLAAGLTGLDRHIADAPQDILAVRHGLQMVRIHAMPDSAQMVEGGVGGDAADRQLVGDAVGRANGAANVKASITRSVYEACPDPTGTEGRAVVRHRAVAVDLGPEPCARGLSGATRLRIAISRTVEAGLGWLRIERRATGATGAIRGRLRMHRSLQLWCQAAGCLQHRRGHLACPIIPSAGGQ